jgi:hypothetical protein
MITLYIEGRTSYIYKPLWDFHGLKSVQSSPFVGLPLPKSEWRGVKPADDAGAGRGQCDRGYLLE